jgi:SMI1-KNR4 cell-wall
MSIERLLAILTPPPAPAETPPREGWHEVESRIGTALPGDYKAFVERYGTGSIDSFLWIFNPFSRNEHVNLIAQVQTQLDALRALRDEFGEDLPYSLYPDDGGLLPFAATDNGDVLHWKTEGTPDEWTVVVNDSRAPEYEEFRSGLTDFLSNLLTRAEACRIFPSGFPQENVTFKPVSPEED